MLVADDMMATVGMPTSETTPAHGQSGAQPPGPPQPNGDSNALIVTGQQRAYLDALKAAGVKPSSDLLALSIGSYVCQARAAKQSDQGCGLRGAVGAQRCAQRPHELDGADGG